MYAGGCLCGKVRYDLGEVPRDTAYCHCESCRRSSGGAFVPWGTVGIEKFRLTQGEMVTVRTSNDVERGFCGACGSTLTYRNALRPEEIDVTLVSLDNPALTAPRMHIWVEDKLPWVVIADGLPQFSKVEGYTQPRS